MYDDLLLTVRHWSTFSESTYAAGTTSCDVGWRNIDSIAINKVAFVRNLLAQTVSVNPASSPNYVRHFPPSIDDNNNNVRCATQSYVDATRQVRRGGARIGLCVVVGVGVRTCDRHRCCVRSCVIGHSWLNQHEFDQTVTQSRQ